MKRTFWKKLTAQETQYADKHPWRHTGLDNDYTQSDSTRMMQTAS